MKKRKDETEELEVNLQTKNQEENANTEHAEFADSIEENGTESNEETEQAEMTADDTVNIEEILAQYSEPVEKKKRGRKSKAKIVEESEPLTIPGELIIHVSDNIAVGCIGFVDNMFSKNPIDPQLLALNDTQKLQLLPAANGVSKELSKHIKANPITSFFAMLGSMYFANYLIIRSLMQKAEKEK